MKKWSAMQVEGGLVLERGQDVRATVLRRTGPLVDGAGATTSDRVQVELVARIVTPTLERPDGMEVAEWRLTPLTAGRR